MVKYFSTLIVGFLMVVAGARHGYAHEPTRLKIMLIAWADIGVQEEVFLAELERVGFKVQPEYFAAKMDRTKLATFLRTSLKQRVQDFDYIYTFGTTASLMAQSIIENRVPQLFHSVNDPIGSGLVSSLKTTGLNINGFSDGIPVEVQINLVRQILAVKSLGFVFNPREPNSNLERQKMKSYCDEFGIKFVDIRVTQEPGQLAKVIADIRAGKIPVDLAVLPQDSFVATHQKQIIDAFNAAKIPSFGTIRDYTNSGALLVMTPDFERGGRELAGMVRDHQQGALLSQIPVIQDLRPEIIVNEETAARLGLQELVRNAGKPRP